MCSRSREKLPSSQESLAACFIKDMYAVQKLLVSLHWNTVWRETTKVLFFLFLFLLDLPLFGCFGEGGRRYLSRKMKPLILVMTAGFAGGLTAAISQGFQKVVGSCYGKSSSLFLHPN